MKKKALTTNLFGFQNLIIAIIVISLYSCSSGNTDRKLEPTKSGGNLSGGIDKKTFNDSSLASPVLPPKLDDYKVILAVDENLKMNETGELRVWIGAKDVNAKFPKGVVQDVTTIPASIGQYAKITPYAPDFEVAPSEIKCIRIDPSGSDVRFSLKPKKSGTFKVSANIELYNSVDCTGTFVPKTAATLSVIVKVDKKQLLVSKLQEMGTIVWNNFISFWSALIALIFAVLLFLIRRKLKRKTGFDDKKS